MIRNPISTLDGGGYTVYGASTHHEALTYSPFPDASGVSRQEPDTRELVLGYGDLGQIAGVKAYIRGAGDYGLQSQIGVRARLYNGSALLAEVDFVMYQYLATHTVLFPVSNIMLTDARLGLKTFDFLGSESQPPVDYTHYVMVVLDDEPNNPPPPFRAVRLRPLRDYLAPCWLLEIVTNTNEPEPVPVGFRFVGSPDGVVESGGWLQLPAPRGEESRFAVWLREV